MNGFFTPDRFTDCQFNLYTVMPCNSKPRRREIVRLEESTSYFADNGLGNGAGVKLTCQAGDECLDQWVVLTWLDWNKFEYESVF